MELDLSQIAIEVNHHGYILVTHMIMQKHVHVCHTSFHEYCYVNVMRSSRLFGGGGGGGGIFEERNSCMETWCFLQIIFCMCAA